MGILGVIVYFWHKKNPPVILHEDYVELNLAIARSKKLIDYRDIQEIFKESEKKAFLIKKDGGTLRLPLVFIDKSEREELVEALREKLSIS